MHRNLNASFEDSSYSKRSHKNPHGSRNKSDKENLRRSFEAGVPHSKNGLPQSHTFAANSPSYGNAKDHTEEVIPVTNILNYPPKKPTELRDNSQNRLNTSHQKINYQDDNEQNFYSNSELISLRKALNEAQIKNTAMSKDLSKFQHENSMLHLQIRRNEIRISELTESRASDQMKIADLASQKSQLSNEMNKLRLETHDNSHKSKENVESLRKNLADIEAITEKKQKKMTRCAKHMRHAIHALQNLLFDLEVTKNPQCQNILDKIQEILDRILNIAASSNHSSQEESNSNDGEEYEMSRSMKGMMEKYQLENNELKDHIAYLENLLQKERFKTKTLLPQYRETVDKLKRSAYGMKERLQESQNLRKEEKNKLASELHESKKINKDLHEEIKSLKVMNSELNGRTKHYESLVTKNEEKVQRLIQDHQRLEKLVKMMKKNEEANKNKESNSDSDNRHYKKRASSRDPQKSSSNKIAIETDGEDTSAARSSLPRSSSASRGSKQQINTRDHHSLRSREGNFEFTFENGNKLSHTLTMESRRNNKHPLNKSIDVDRLRSSKLAKSFWVEDPQAIAPNNDNSELMARCFTLQKSRCDDTDQQQPSVIEHKSQGGPRGFFGSQLEDYQEAESTHGESEQENSFNDLKDEIASLENEIGEIDNYMKDQMNTINSTYIDN